MRLPPLSLVVLDTETTGFVPRAHHVIEFACAQAVDGKVTTEYEQLFTCDAIPPLVEVLTRIRTADLAGKPTFAEKTTEILSRLPENALIVGQNVNFDIGMLKGEGIDLSNRAWIDTSMLASLVFPELQSYSLGYLSKVLKLNHSPPHRALGDVRATLELLGKCWERLLELPPELREIACAIMEKAPEGYRRLFAALPPAAQKTEPSWLRWKELKEDTPAPPPLTLPVPAAGEVLLQEEPLDPTHLQALLHGAINDATTRRWITVKNLRASLERLPAELHAAMEDGRVRALHPPEFLLDRGAVERLATQAAYTADEATLALKIAWYPGTTHDDMPVHGGEEAVWNGKVACTEASNEYLAQFRDPPQVALLDHRELLGFLESPDHPAQASLRGKLHVLIDDASMLEDTATRAYGWYCAVDDMRAAAQGDALLTRFMDVFQLWMEKTRQFQDIRYLSEPDLRSAEARGVRELLVEMTAKEGLPEKVLESLRNLAKILDPQNLGGRFAWIEQRQNGSQTLQSVPERIGAFLQQSLFSKHPVTLLIPTGAREMLPEILPPTIKSRGSKGKSETFEGELTRVPLSFNANPGLEELLTNPPPGKTIILLPSRGMIEDYYVKCTEPLEKDGVTLICQGVGGGLGRMQAEFTAAPAPALWLLTPWMFEGIDLPAGLVDHLVIRTLPFDHPSHPVISRRSAHYEDPFQHYCLPRLMHRLFRVIRTFCRFRTGTGDVRLLDDRIFSKSYGKKVREYLDQISVPPTDEPDAPRASTGKSSVTTKPLSGTLPTKKPAPKQKSPPKDPSGKDQMALF